METINNDSEYETIEVKPDMLCLLNLFTIIYNKSKKKQMSLITGVNPRVPNDTSEIQEEFNSIIVDHLHLEHEDPENITIYNIDDNVSTSNNNDIYVLIVDSSKLFYSKSRLSLLICGSNIIKKNYNTDIDIQKII